MSKVQTNQTAEAAAKKDKGFNGKKVTAIVMVAIILGVSVFGFGFTGRGRTILRVIVEPAPAVNAYAAQDRVIEAAKAEFNAQIASPKAE